MTSYKSAGVNISAANESVKKIGFFAKKTFNKTVLKGIGAFGGAIDASILKDFKKPVLVSTIDGVGTKVKIAQMLNKWDTVGSDIVNHCSDDILALGAKPLFFLDYLASSRLEPKKIEKIVYGMSVACKKIDCPLIGGETAEMPGVYEKGELGIAGCMVGVVDSEKIIDGSKIKEGDVLIGLASNGLHTNGYSLARKVLLREKRDKKILKELLRVHKSYSNNVLALAKKIEVKGIAHITGGGLIENIPRVLPKNQGVLIEKNSWQIPEIFSLIQKKGSVDELEMHRVFNMGVGLVLIISPKEVEKCLVFLKKQKEKAFLMGKVIKDKKKRVILHG